MDDNGSLMILSLPLLRHLEAQRFRMTLGSELRGSLEKRCKIHDLRRFFTEIPYRQLYESSLSIEVIKIKVESQKK